MTSRNFLVRVFALSIVLANSHPHVIRKRDLDAKTFDDPDFIPGKDLDVKGRKDLVTPPPILDIFTQFSNEIASRNEVVWRYGPLLFLLMLLAILMLAIGALVPVLVLSLRNSILEMKPNASRRNLFFDIALEQMNNPKLNKLMSRKINKRA